MTGENLFLALLGKDDIRAVYKYLLCRDFPKSERKPLSAILRAYRRGDYQAFGLTEDGETILAYAFFVRTGEDYLLDYLATDADRRSQGIGSAFLSLLKEHFRPAASLIAEVEDPDAAGNEEERVIRTRRLAFYEKNGFVKTNYTPTTFGVPFLVIAPEGKVPSDVRAVYHAHYEKMLPRAVLRRAICD